MKILRALFASILLITSALQAVDMLPPAEVLPITQLQQTLTPRTSNHIKNLWKTITNGTRSQHQIFKQASWNGISYLKKNKRKIKWGLGLTALAAYGVFAYRKYRTTGINPFHRATEILNQCTRSIDGYLNTAHVFLEENVAPLFEEHISPLFEENVTPLFDEPEEPAIRECSLCFDKKNLNQFTELECGHKAHCNTCLTRFLNIALRDKNTGTLTCPTGGCQSEISEADVRKLTQNNPENYEQFCDIKTNEYLDTQASMKQCPTTNCSYRFIYDQPTGMLANFSCPKCHDTYCVNCLLKHSQATTCREAKQNHLDSQGDTEAASTSWISTNTRNCPSCQKAIEKNEGCIHMTCSNRAGGCGHQFCWHCGANWNNHSSPGAPIRNQGDFYGCPNPHEWWITK